MHKLSRDGAKGQALVLETKAYVHEVESGRTSACRYRLRVQFDDGSTAEMTYRAFGHAVASADVGDIIPVRYDPADRTKIEIDRHAVIECQEAEARKWEAEAISRGETALGLSSSATQSRPVADQRQPAANNLRIGDADRDRIAEVLGRHMTDGRLTTDELDDRLGALYTSQTRQQARSVLDSLPPLAPTAAQPDEAVPILPDWASAPEPEVLRSPTPVPAGGPNSDVAAPVPTEGELNTAYRRWQAKAEKLKADKAAHEQAEASGDSREAVLAFKYKKSRAEEKNARAKLDQLRKRRPDWTVGEP